MFGVEQNYNLLLQFKFCVLKQKEAGNFQILDKSIQIVNLKDQKNQICKMIGENLIKRQHQSDQFEQVPSPDQEQKNNFVQGKTSKLIQNTKNVPKEEYLKTETAHIDQVYQARFIEKKLKKKELLSSKHAQDPGNPRQSSNSSEQLLSDRLLRHYAEHNDLRENPVQDFSQIQQASQVRKTKNKSQMEIERLQEKAFLDHPSQQSIEGIEFAKDKISLKIPKKVKKAPKILYSKSKAEKTVEIVTKVSNKKSLAADHLKKETQYSSKNRFQELLAQSHLKNPAWLLNQYKTGNMMPQQHNDNGISKPKKRSKRCISQLKSNNCRSSTTDNFLDKNGRFRRGSGGHDTHFAQKDDDALQQSPSFLVNSSRQNNQQKVEDYHHQTAAEVLPLLNKAKQPPAHHQNQENRGSTTQIETQNVDEDGGSTSEKKKIVEANRSSIREDRTTLLNVPSLSETSESVQDDNKGVVIGSTLLRDKKYKNVTDSDMPYRSDPRPVDFLKKRAKSQLKKPIAPNDSNYEELTQKGRRKGQSRENFKVQQNSLKNIKVGVYNLKADDQKNIQNQNDINKNAQQNDKNLLMKESRLSQQIQQKVTHKRSKSTLINRQMQKSQKKSNYHSILKSTQSSQGGSGKPLGFIQQKKDNFTNQSNNYTSNRQDEETIHLNGESRLQFKKQNSQNQFSQNLPLKPSILSNGNPESTQFQSPSTDEQPILPDLDKQVLLQGCKSNTNLGWQSKTNTQIQKLITSPKQELLEGILTQKHKRVGSAMIPTGRHRSSRYSQNQYTKQSRDDIRHQNQFDLKEVMSQRQMLFQATLPKHIQQQSPPCLLNSERINQISGGEENYTMRQGARGGAGKLATSIGMGSGLKNKNNLDYQHMQQAQKVNENERFFKDGNKQRLQNIKESLYRIQRQKREIFAPTKNFIPTSAISNQTSYIGSQTTNNNNQKFISKREAENFKKRNEYLQEKFEIYQVESTIEQNVDTQRIYKHESEKRIHLRKESSEEQISGINDKLESHLGNHDQCGVTQMRAGSQSSLTDSYFYFLPGVETDDTRKAQFQKNCANLAKIDRRTDLESQRNLNKRLILPEEIPRRPKSSRRFHTTQKQLSNQIQRISPEQKDRNDFDYQQDRSILDQKIPFNRHNSKNKRLMSACARPQQTQSVQDFVIKRAQVVGNSQNQPIEVLKPKWVSSNEKREWGTKESNQNSIRLKDDIFRSNVGVNRQQQQKYGHRKQQIDLLFTRQLPLLITAFTHYELTKFQKKKPLVHFEQLVHPYVDMVIQKDLWADYQAKVSKNRQQNFKASQKLDWIRMALLEDDSILKVNKEGHGNCQQKSLMKKVIQNYFKEPLKCVTFETELKNKHINEANFLVSNPDLQTLSLWIHKNPLVEQQKSQIFLNCTFQAQRFEKDETQQNSGISENRSSILSSKELDFLEQYRMLKWLFAYRWMNNMAEILSEKEPDLIDLLYNMDLMEGLPQPQQAQNQFPLQFMPLEQIYRPINKQNRAQIYEEAKQRRVDVQRYAKEMCMVLSDDLLKQFEDVDYLKLRKFNDLYESIEDFMTDKKPMFDQFLNEFRSTFIRWNTEINREYQQEIMEEINFVEIQICDKINPPYFSHLYSEIVQSEDAILQAYFRQLNHVYLKYPPKCDQYDQMNADETVNFRNSDYYKDIICRKKGQQAIYNGISLPLFGFEQKTATDNLCNIDSLFQLHQIEMNYPGQFQLSKMVQIAKNQDPEMFKSINSYKSGNKVKTSNVSQEKKEASYQSYFQKIHLVDPKMSSALFASSVYKEKFAAHREFIDDIKMPRFEIIQVINPWLEQKKLKLACQREFQVIINDKIQKQNQILDNQSQIMSLNLDGFAIESPNLPLISEKRQRKLDFVLDLYQNGFTILPFTKTLFRYARNNPDFLEAFQNPSLQDEFIDSQFKKATQKSKNSIDINSSQDNLISQNKVSLIERRNSIEPQISPNKASAAIQNESSAAIPELDFKNSPAKKEGLVTERDLHFKSTDQQASDDYRATTLRQLDQIDQEEEQRAQDTSSYAVKVGKVLHKIVESDAQEDSIRDFRDENGEIREGQQLLANKGGDRQTEHQARSKKLGQESQHLSNEPSCFVNEGVSTQLNAKTEDLDSKKLEQRKKIVTKKPSRDEISEETFILPQSKYQTKNSERNRKSKLLYIGGSADESFSDRQSSSQSSEKLSENSDFKCCESKLIDLQNYRHQQILNPKFPKLEQKKVKDGELENQFIGQLLREQSQGEDQQFKSKKDCIQTLLEHPKFDFFNSWMDSAITNVPFPKDKNFKGPLFDEQISETTSENPDEKKSLEIDDKKEISIDKEELLSANVSASNSTKLMKNNILNLYNVEGFRKSQNILQNFELDQTSQKEFKSSIIPASPQLLQQNNQTNKVSNDKGSPQATQLTEIGSSMMAYFEHQVKKQFFCAVLEENCDEISNLIRRFKIQIDLPRDSHGNTALMLAVQNNKMRSVYTLIELGADQYAQNDQGICPAHFAFNLRPGVVVESTNANFNTIQRSDTEEMKQSSSKSDKNGPHLGTLNEVRELESDNKIEQKFLEETDGYYDLQKQEQKVQNENKFDVDFEDELLQELIEESDSDSQQFQIEDNID